MRYAPRCLTRLLGAYMLSPPVFASDAQPANPQSLERFSHQLECDAQMACETQLPSIASLLEVGGEAAVASEPHSEDKPAKSE